MQVFGSTNMNDDPKNPDFFSKSQRPWGIYKVPFEQMWTSSPSRCVAASVPVPGPCPNKHGKSNGYARVLPGVLKLSCNLEDLASVVLTLSALAFREGTHPQPQIVEPTRRTLAAELY